MRAAIASAVVGDDVLGEDPTVNLLEAEAASFLGKEAALFLPSGTMANQVAIFVHCRPGDELICDQRSHVFLFEGGGIACLSGTQAYALQTEGGFPSPDDLRAAVRSADVHHPRSRLLVLENTHNVAGGRVLGPSALKELVGVAQEVDLKVHVDGARLVNAAVACDCPPSRLTEGVDSVSLCLSKGLGAPVGSMLAGTEEFIAKARRARKTFGGGMRQAGVLAAAGLLALREGPKCLPADHARAHRIAETVRSLPGMQVGPTETNMVMLTPSQGTPTELVEHLASCQILALAYHGGTVRLVTHKDLVDEHIDRCCQELSRWAEQRSSKSS